MLWYARAPIDRYSVLPHVCSHHGVTQRWYLGGDIVTMSSACIKRRGAVTDTGHPLGGISTVQVPRWSLTCIRSCIISPTSHGENEVLNNCKVWSKCNIPFFLSFLSSPYPLLIMLMCYINY